MPVLNSGEDAYLGMISRLRDRLAQLQVHTDREAGQLIDTLRADSLAEAIDLRDTFDAGWFGQSLFSDHVQKQIAQALIIATHRYPLVDTSIWRRVLK